MCITLAVRTTWGELRTWGGGGLRTGGGGGLRAGGGGGELTGGGRRLTQVLLLSVKLDLHSKRTSDYCTLRCCWLALNISLHIYRS